MENKKNCWEFMKCGRELGGSQAKQLGICPAYTERKLDGAHSGKNAGRACWVVAGTLCKGETQGTFAKKFENCEKCPFYAQVRKEEFPKFILALSLLKRLRA